MTSDLERLAREARAALNTIRETAGLDAWAVRFLGRQGAVASFSKRLATLPAGERPAAGQALNRLKAELRHSLEARRAEVSAAAFPAVDLTLPGLTVERGHRHPVTALLDRIRGIWMSLGYRVHQGNELEEDWHNFTGLNIPKHHPSRDLQDTFYLQGLPGHVLRTHTSTAQLRATAKAKPPFRFVELGRVYRHEATDASHESTFFQCDGFAVDRDVRLTDLLGTLTRFVETLFERKVTVRFRPHFYPFVEPGLDLDLQCILCGGQGCAVCKQTGWLEMLGAGMIHPAVLKNMGLDAKRWRGFAFGMGVDRFAMLLHGYRDIRLSHSGDLRFLEQFD